MTMCLWCGVQFYLMVVAYIYFTRIVVFLVKATLPYELLWLQQLFDESATLLFYFLTGFKFRPADANPYLAVRARV
jgi:G protein-coupled receptor 107